MATVKFGFNAEEVADDCSKANIKTLKKWVLDESVPELTNEQLLHFLLRSDHELDEAKNIIKTCYHLKAKAPSIFTKRKVEDDLKKFLEQIIEICTMPQRTEDGCAIIFMRFRDPNYKNLRMEDYFKAFFMTVDSILYQQPVSGVVAIFDLAGVSFMHLTKLKINLLRIAILYLQDGVPVKFKALHCINAGSVIERIVKMIRPFTKNELLEKLMFHPRNLNMEEFYTNHLEKKCLPEDLGGELPSVPVLHERHIKKLSELEEHFRAEEEQRSGC